MMRALDTTLSDGIGRLRDDANDVLKGTVFACAFSEQLVLLQKLAISLERELAMHRDNEAGKGMRTHIEQTATDHLTDMLPAEGTVIRPDFGRKS